MRRSPLGVLVGVGLFLIGAGAVGLSSSFDSPSAAAVLGGEVPINTGAGNRADTSSHNSPTLVRNPVRGANLAVANRIDTPRYSCALHVSFDGGATWRQTPIPAPRGEEPKCWAPDAAFASDGTLYLSFVTLKGQGNVPHAVWTSTSKDGGRTLSKPRRALGRLSFQVRLSVDPAKPRRIYLTWVQGADVGFLRFSRPGNPIRVVRSEDGGRTWGRPVRVSSPARARAIAPSPAVGPHGELYVLYLDLGDDRLDYDGGHEGQGGPPYPGPHNLVVARSRNKGASWEESVVENRLVPIHRFVVFFPPSPSVAVDRRSGRVYAGFHDARLGDPDVLVWSLVPGGKSWEGPTRVNDTPMRDGTWQYLPKLAVAPNGRLDVTYYDRRSDRGNVMSHVSLQSSFHARQSFAPAVRLSSTPFDSRIGFGSGSGLPELGSRLGLVSDDRRSLAVWTDTRAGTQASNKQDLASALVGFSESPPRLSEPAKHGLRYGGVCLAFLGLALLAWWLVGLQPRRVSGSSLG